MSRIEQIIAEIEDYIDGCKFQTFSSTNIVVNKEEMEEFLVELKMRVPDEIKKYQKIVNQQDAILEDARSQAQGMISDAKSQIDELVSDHEVMQLAYQKAGEIVDEARKQADSIIEEAYTDAREIRNGAASYADSVFEVLENISEGTLSEEQKRFEAFAKDLQSVYETCSENRRQIKEMLMPENTEENT